jgi:hypothetical protein
MGIRPVFVAAVALSLVASGCAGPMAVPGPGDIFSPDPGHHFHAATGEVLIVGLAGHTVCFTTDGSTPAYSGGSCSGGTTARLAATNRIPLRCGADTTADAIQGIKLAFDWPGTEGPTVQTVAGNFVLDCTQPEPDTDGDGIPNSMDNCPMHANRDQADANGNSIGDVCEAMGAPDADGDGRPDSADNCPRVWNVNQADDDRDGVGNVCDTTPRGPAPLPWNNGLLARAFAAWKDELQCSLNGCRNPGGAGSWRGTCDNGGTIDWNVGLSGLRAISTFTYANCQNTVTVNVHDYMRDPRNMDPTATRPMDITLTADGRFTQDTDFSGNGTESGMVTLTGSFAGTVVSHVQIRDARRGTGSYFSVSCTMDPIEQEMCAPSNLAVNYYFPDWTCEMGACPTAPPPLTDRDGDGVFDEYDNCPDVANPTQANADFDREGDACDMSTSATDTDRDGVPDAGDNCPMVANPMQQDTDRDGVGDACDMVSDPDTDMDGVIDSRDNCPRNANPTQTDMDRDGLGDACDPTPNGAPRFSMLKLKLGRCLYDNGGDVRSTSSCDATQTNQQWEVIDAGGGRRVFRNLSSMQCIVASTWAGAIGMAACDMANSAQQWAGERYDQGGFDMQFPMRLHSAAQNYCLYTDGTGDVYATQGNCGLLGTENNRKVGIYADGDFMATPAQP